MRQTSHPLRAIALPVVLCVMWLFNGKRLLLTVTNKANQQAHTHTTTPQLQQTLDEAQESIVLKDDASFLVVPNDKKTWYDDNEAVQALQEELANVLSPDDLKNWYTTPNFHPHPATISCPSTKKFAATKFQPTLLGNLTKQEKTQIRRKLLNVRSKTIRNAFMPWIDTGGFHPDLIVHGSRVAGLMVGVFDGKLVFWGKNHRSAKVKLLAEHLESVLYEFHKKGIKIPDVVFPYTVRSIPRETLTKHCAHRSVPPHLKDRYDAIPVAGIAMDPTIHTGVALMPNMYFGNLRVWDRYTKQLLEGGKADTEWNKRCKRVFWRGKIGKRLDHNAPRLEALQAASRDVESGSKQMDIALTSGCEWLPKYTKNYTRSAPHAPEWMPRDFFLNTTKCGSEQRTPHSKFSKYWAQLNLPGSSMGSYSKNLQNLWPLGAATLIWNQSAVEFYYDSLQTGITHAWVNETTIAPTTQILFENEGKIAKLMGQVGREWFQQHLTSKAILNYYRHWFQTWAALQRFVPSPKMLEDPCTCAGWIDGDKKKHDGMKRCNYCASYPHRISKGCMSMMGLSDSSLCKG